MNTRPGYYSEITRDEAYIISRDSAEPVRRRVYAAIVKLGKCTRREIADATGLELATVCGRVKELLIDELIFEVIDPRTKEPVTKVNPKSNVKNILLTVNSQATLSFRT
jgi:DNA-binding MarR family transcriptional regulator